MFCTCQPDGGEIGDREAKLPLGKKVLTRIDGRQADELRPVKITRRFTKHAPGSVLIRSGDTHVLCTACLERGVPDWKVGSGSGWCTAEYDMLPGSTTTRRRRNRNRIDGRTREIQRFIGRSVRAVLDLDALGENSILIDCDVLQADGGTRTASVTGAYIAACDAVQYARGKKWIDRSPFVDGVAAVSVGLVARRSILDLNYAEDIEADVDMNVVMTAAGRLVEVQGNGEGATFTRQDLNRLVGLAAGGIKKLSAIQQRTLKRRRSG